MILDTAQVSLPDWSHRAAIEIYAGNEIGTPKGKKAKILARTIGTRPDVISLLLSSGATLTGTSDQRVCLPGKRPIVMADVKLGVKLLGSEQGLPTVVYVTGIMKQALARLVEFDIAGRKPFIVEGVVCRT